MILHQQLPHTKDAPLEPWFAVYVESLTLAFCRHYGDTVAITQLIPEFTAPSFTSCPPNDYPILAEKLISGNISRHGKNPVINPPSLLSQYSPPEWILLNSLDGTTPAVMHTADPVFICLADRKTAILHPTEHFRSSVDLSVEGWTYWHEDAQAHFEKLTVEFCQATGIPIPARIAAAVRHT
jgi:hypothetical protein